MSLDKSDKSQDTWDKQEKELAKPKDQANQEPEDIDLPSFQVVDEHNQLLGAFTLDLIKEQKQFYRAIALFLEDKSGHLFLKLVQGEFFDLPIILLVPKGLSRHEACQNWLSQENLLLKELKELAMLPPDLTHPRSFLYVYLAKLLINVQSAKDDELWLTKSEQRGLKEIKFTTSPLLQAIAQHLEQPILEVLKN